MPKERDRKREDRLPGLNWNCHVRASEATQRKNNLYRIGLNCERLADFTHPILSSLPSTVFAGTSVAANSMVDFRGQNRVDFRDERGRM